jgi:bacterial/archaeal transporter family protein
MSWLLYAFISAAAAALTAILGKVGVEGVPSNLAIAIRTIVMTGFAWAIVAATGEHRALMSLSRRSVVFLLLSGSRPASRGLRTSAHCNSAPRRGSARSTK